MWALDLFNEVVRPIVARALVLLSSRLPKASSSYLGFDCVVACFSDCRSIVFSVWWVLFELVCGYQIPFYKGGILVVKIYAMVL